MCPSCGYPWAHGCHHHWHEYGPPPWAARWERAETPYARGGRPTKEERKAALERMKERLEAQLGELNEELQGL